jgi:hypothetical protein
MVFSFYVFGIFLAAVLGWASWIVVINNLSPFISGSLALTLFYSSLFVALTGTFSILNYYLRISVSKSGEHAHHLNASLRQGSLLSIMILVGLAFQRLRVLTWWDALLLLVIILLIEYYFMSRG